MFQVPLVAGILKIVLAESALELVPPELWGHPAVRKNAARRGKSPGETLLDVSLHYSAMRRLDQHYKRGRPDIVHVTLLELLSSPLSLEGRLRVYIHTIGNAVIFVNPSVRIPKNYNRFVGLMEQLLVEGRVPPRGEALLYARTMTLKRLLELVSPRCVILLDEAGDPAQPAQVVDEALRQDCAIVIGGFPHGGFSEETYRLASAIYSIYDKPLEAWVVASRIVCAAENLLGLLGKRENGAAAGI